VGCSQGTFHSNMVITTLSTNKCVYRIRIRIELGRGGAGS
jgi:hypothetical protein